MSDPSNSGAEHVGAIKQGIANAVRVAKSVDRRLPDLPERRTYRLSGEWDYSKAQHRGKLAEELQTFWSYGPEWDGSVTIRADEGFGEAFNNENRLPYCEVEVNG